MSYDLSQKCGLLWIVSKNSGENKYDSDCVHNLIVMWGTRFELSQVFTNYFLSLGLIIEFVDFFPMLTQLDLESIFFKN